MKNLLILLTFVLFSCASKKEVKTEKLEHFKTDTIIREKIVVKTETIIDTFSIDKPCDEKGVLKDFNQRILTGAGFVHVWSNEGKIHAKLHLKETLNVNDKEKIVKIEYKDKIITKEVFKTKYKERWYLLITLVLSLLLNYYLWRSK
jgi:hypothetical protein